MYTVIKYLRIMLSAKVFPAGVEFNAHGLGHYTALCQEVGLVPIFEPEVLMDSGHTMQRGSEVAQEVLQIVFSPFECNECLIQVAAALGTVVFVWPRQPSTKTLAAANAMTRWKRVSSIDVLKG